MAGNEIRYNVKVDASGANRALTAFGRAAEKAGKDAADALDDTASAGDKARAALTAMATAMDSELREAAAAADALRTALGESGDKFDADQIVADLNRMGVSFDEIRGDADKFAATLKQVDNINVKQVNDGLGKTKDALDGVRDNADQSRSVLANMAGNATQDMAELGGVTGTAGMALGQLAEYATEGNISLKNLAAVAGPMVGIMAALKIGSNVMQFLGRDAKAAAEQFDTMTEALKDGQSALEASNAALAETGELVTPDNIDDGFIRELGEAFLGWEEGTLNLNDALLNMGVTFDDWSRGVTGTVADARDLTVAIKDAGEAGDITAEQEQDLVKALYESRTAWADAGRAADDYATLTADNASTIGEANQAMIDQAVAAQHVKDAWTLVLADLRDDGVIKNTISSWNTLREELGLTEQELADLAASKVAETLERDAAAADELEAELAAAAEAAAEYGRVIGSAEWGSTGIEAATTAYEEYRQLVTGDRQRVADSEEAWDGLGESIEAGAGHLMELTSPEGRAVYDALDELGTAIVPDLAKAFDDSNGDIRTFRRSVDSLATTTLRRLQDEFGLSEEQAGDMIAELGLMPDQVETFYKLSGDAEAKLQLELLQGYIDGLPRDVQTTITQQILLGDYQGAVAEVQHYADAHDVTLDVNADISKALEALRRLQAIARFSQVVVSVGARSTTAGYATPAPSVMRSAAVVPYAAPRPVNVTVNTAVVGDRYDVARVVSRAVAGAVRLGGRR